MLVVQIGLTVRAPPIPKSLARLLPDCTPLGPVIITYFMA